MDDIGCDSSEDNIVEEQPNVKGGATRGLDKRFTPAQRACLNANYASGMVGTGRKHQILLDKTASDTMLTMDQIKV